MAKNVDSILDQRSHRLTRKERTRPWLASFLFHALLSVAFWVMPELLAKPPAEIEYVPVMVVSPAMLGISEPPPPPPPPEPEPDSPREGPPPALEPIEEDTMVLPSEEEKAERPPPPPPPPQPESVEPPPKRSGSPFGAALGASTEKARVGVEDPNFTYGYYLNRVVSAISANWVRPPVGGVEQAMLNFRIQRDGTITALRVAETSGSEIFDLAAFRAVEASSPLPPLPKGYKEPSLGINLIVR